MDETKNNVKEGYLFVQTSSVFKHWGSYKAKYLILTNDYLYCFNRCGEISSIPKDVISLEDVSIMVEESRRGFSKRFLIKVRTNKMNKKCFTFISFEAKERDEWLSCILQVLAAKFTNRISENKNESHPKTKRTSLLVNPEKEKLKSLSCLDLTNMEVVVNDPFTSHQSITSLRKAFCEKFSASSIDISRQTSPKSASFLKVYDTYKSSHLSPNVKEDGHLNIVGKNTNCCNQLCVF